MVVSLSVATVRLCVFGKLIGERTFFLLFQVFILCKQSRTCSISVELLLYLLSTLRSNLKSSTSSSRLHQYVSILTLNRIIIVDVSTDFKIHTHPSHSQLVTSVPFPLPPLRSVCASLLDPSTLEFSLYDNLS